MQQFNFFVLFRMFSILKLVRSENPNIVHAVALKPILLSALALLAKRETQFVFAFSGMGYIFSSSDRKAGFIRALLLKILRLLIRRENAWVLVQNRSDFALMRSLMGDKNSRLKLIAGSGIDTKHFQPSAQTISDPQVVVVLAARMLRDKGIFEFVEAAKVINEHTQRATFWLVGPIDEDNPGAISRAELNALVESADGKVIWKGYVEDMRDVYRDADIVCLPSYREGLPKVLLEAAACGKALVATDVPGCKDICRAGESGMLVPPRDAHALATALSALVDNSETRLSCGRVAREIVENEFSLDAIEQQTREFYRSILDFKN